ncbi:RNA methyltransferase [Snodgrassella communis]|uniref:RNA methyltransferase n=1 Tax=Snodgrassella alvi TaxID=1196083 RepID=A0A2N9XIB7_9NEIS|nr:RNA methyltransferase [Snodgrassella communis]PIT48072.1 RNA methyltransferase [Snodgrassella communis]
MNKPILPDFLNNITIVLTRTSHPANIGSAARAMKTMGLNRLILVAPNLMQTPITPRPAVFDHTNPAAFVLPEESFTLASGACDVLENALIFASLNEALADTTLSCALTSRRRELTAPLHTPREIMPSLIDAARTGQKIALVFGNETFGLSIEEVQSCNRLITINGNPDYFSLNLAQAVQVICYELFSHVDISMAYLKQQPNLATHQQTSSMVEHLRQVMDTAGFFNRRNEERLMRRMAAMFDRAQLSTEDIDILRGFYNTVNHQIQKKQN